MTIGMVGQAHDFQQAMHAATNNAERLKIFEKTINSFGYTRFKYARVQRHAVASKHPYLSFSNHPKSWREFYIDQKLYDCDVLVEHCKRTITPLLWSSVFNQIDNGTLDKHYTATMNSARDHGFQCGVTIPLKSEQHLDAGISLVIDAEDSQAEHDKQFVCNQMELLSITNIFHSYIDMQHQVRDYFGLSSREHEAILWLSEGYQYQEIAEKLGNSEFTVEKQARSAYRKLNARNAAQAVAIALRQGLIT